MDKKLFKNVASLFGIQGMNYFIPLITLPYLVRTLGPESYGVLGFSLAFVQYFSLLTDYGFNLSATRKVSMCQNEKKKISIIFWHVLICKIILALFGCIILAILCSTVPYVSDQSVVIWSAYGVVLGNILFPIWLFQGKEQMGFSSLTNIVSRAFAVPLIFIFVDDANDAWVAAMITSISAILGGFISVALLWRKKWLTLTDISVSGVIKEYKDGWHVFLSTAAVSLYTTSITVVLGFIAGPLAVGYFVAADKLRQAIQGLLAPISQAVYPRINSMMISDSANAFIYIKKLLHYFSAGGFVLSIAIFIFSPFCVNLLYGSNYQPSVIVLYILASCPLLVAVSNVLGVQTMLVLGYNKEFSRILIVSGLLCLMVLFPLSSFWKEAGAAWSVLLTEISVTIMMLVFIKRKKIPLY